MLEKELKLFLKDNAKDQTTLQDLWDTTKAYIRGLTITYVARKNKDKKKTTELQEKHDELEHRMQKEPQNKEIKKEREVTEHIINLTLQDEMKQNLRMVKQNYFDKLGR
uniref:Uncharacterized protein n=1 Tax=Micrurus lemniscatus lemniscatus TaxID=129467 RepID=A0A2D4ICM9_MICLE